jgi:hypothetical protein
VGQRRSGPTDWLRGGATAIAAARTAIGVVALAALQQPPAGARPAGHPGIWIGIGALSDAMDVLATVAAWDELPPVGRWLVAVSAGGAAVAGAAAAGSLLTGAAADGA